MCLICDRIQLIKKGANPYFVKELETGYVVLGDHQHFSGYTLFLCKQHVTELHLLEPIFRDKFLAEMALVSAAVSRAFSAQKMNLELLGNGDSHIHWHLFPRQAGDLGEYGMNGKGPVWWYPAEKMFAPETQVDAATLCKLEEQLLAELKLVD